MNNVNDFLNTVSCSLTHNDTVIAKRDDRGLIYIRGFWTDDAVNSIPVKDLVAKQNELLEKMFVAERIEKRDDFYFICKDGIGIEPLHKSFFKILPQ